MGAMREQNPDRKKKPEPPPVFTHRKHRSPDINRRKARNRRRAAKLAVHAEARRDNREERRLAVRNAKRRLEGKPPLPLVPDEPAGAVVNA